MDLKEIAEAYQLVYEKKKLDPVGKEDDDVDNDGDSDSSDEYLKKRRAAISKAMGKDGDDKDDDKDDDDNGDSKGLSAGQKKLPPQLQKAIAKKGKKSDKKESLDLMSAYYSMYEHHKKDEDGNTIPHEEEIDEEEVKKLKPNYKDQRYARTRFDAGNISSAKYDKLEAGREEEKERKKDEAKKSIEKFRTGVQNMPSKRKVEGIDLSFVDELSEEELDVLVEEVVYDLLDEGIELDAVEGAFTQYLEEAKVTYGSDTENPMVAQVKKRKEEKAKAQKERAEKFKKSVGKAVQGVKAKAHGKLADYAGKRKLIPTKGAKAAAAKPERVAPSEPKNKTKKAQKEFEVTKKGVEAANKDRAEKMSKRQRSQDIKKGLGDKEKRQGLRSAVFKDVKDRVGKKAKAVIDAPRKAGEGIRKVGGSIKKGIGGLVDSGKKKSAGVLRSIADKIYKEGRELDMFDTVTAYLIDEGLARDFDHAQRVMTTLDSTLIEEVHAEQMQFLEKMATPESGTGKYYNEKKPTDQQLANRKKQQKIKDLTNQGKHQEASKLYNTNESLTDAYLKVYEESGKGFGEPKPEGSEQKGEKKVKPKKERMTQQDKNFARKTFGGFNRKFGK